MPSICRIEPNWQAWTGKPFRDLLQKVAANHPRLAGDSDVEVEVVALCVPCRRPRPADRLPLRMPDRIPSQPGHLARWDGRDGPACSECDPPTRAPPQADKHRQSAPHAFPVAPADKFRAIELLLTIPKVSSSRGRMMFTIMLRRTRWRSDALHRPAGPAASHARHPARTARCR